MIEFIEESHTYLIDGVITPSVSEILHFIFPDKYKNVNQKVLNQKAEYGSKVHEAIECLEQNKDLAKLDINQEFSLGQYKRLKEKNNIDVLMQEQIINYQTEYAGRFDMVAMVNGNLSLCDIKTTAQLDKEYLSWQLSFYELANMSMYHTEQFEKLYAIWLPKKGYGELVEIERKSINELLRVIKEFKESRKEKQ
jgi:hypothetical protein